MKPRGSGPTPFDLSKDETPFWDRVHKTDGCWNWIGRLYKGYGYMMVNYQQRRAHRLSWTLANGTIPDGMNVCHRCDNPKCVRPSHLFLGTHTENIADMDAKGRRRIVRGEDRAPKLTENMVHQIRSMRGTMSQREIGIIFGVHQVTVSDVLGGRRWGWLKGNDNV